MRIDHRLGHPPPPQSEALDAQFFLISTVSLILVLMCALAPFVCNRLLTLTPAWVVIWMVAEIFDLAVKYHKISTVKACALACAVSPVSESSFLWWALWFVRYMCVFSSARHDSANWPNSAFWNSRLIPCAIPNGVLSVPHYITDLQRMGTLPSYIRGHISDAGDHVVKSGHSVVVPDGSGVGIIDHLTMQEMSLRRAVITLSA